MKLHIHIILIRYLTLIMFFLIFSAESDGQYQIKSGVLAGGGGVTQGSSFRMQSTIGQSFIGETITAEFRIAMGMYPQYDIVTSVKRISDDIPLTYHLEQNYPNPFNPTTHFEFRIADFGLATLKIYDLLGREVAVILNEEKHPGIYKVEFNAGKYGLASGIYFYRLKAGKFSAVKKCILLK